MNRKLLGGLLAAGLTAAALGALPLSAEAGTIAKASPVAATAAAQDSGRNLIQSKAPQLRISKYETFKLAQPVTPGAKGLKYAAYERTYRGLPVHGGDFVVTTDRQGRIVGTSVAQKARIGDLSITPSVSADRASTVARTTLDHATAKGRPELVIEALGKPPSGLAGPGQRHREDGDHAVENVYVDARTGAVLARDSLLHYGSGTGHHNGPNPLSIDTTQVSASSYSLKDPGITNLDCRDDGTNAVMTGPDDNWGDGTGTSKETGCVDALFSLQTQDNMLHAWLGRNSFNGSGGGWKVRVGKDEINAFYCPPGLVEAGYCDGTEQVRIGHNQAGSKWLTNLDVMAHEYGHGIDQNTPGGHSGGGTSEFVGDVFGALTEAYANQSAAYDPPDYTMGEEVDLVGQGPIRTMYNPSVNGDPNCYSSSIPNTEVHAAAGPGNHWFYLLAEGTNPSGKPVQPDVQRLVQPDGHRHPGRRHRSSTTRC